MSAGAQPWPTSIRYRAAAREISIAFDDGSAFDLPAEYLRVESPSAEVQGHGASTKTLVSGKRNVGVRDMQEVGRYAVRIIFDDGHDTGLYAWDYLHTLGREYKARWSAYEASLRARGLTRDM